MYKKLFISFLLIVMVQLSFIKVIDKSSSEQLDRAFTRSLSVFAIVRSLNGLISVAQGTEVYATPAGVGVNFAVGQIVDPMNDMLERFSWIMLLSSVSLGVQEILLHFGQTELVQGLLGVSVLILLALLWIPKLWHKEGFNLIFKSFIIFSFLRFLVPLIVLINEGVYEYGLQEQYEKAKGSLEVTQMQTEIIVQKVRQTRQDHESSWLESLNVKQQVEEFRVKMKTLWINLKNKFSHAIDYMLSLISIFIVQSILLPLLSLWLFFKLFRKLISTDIAGIIENKTTKNV